MTTDTASIRAISLRAEKFLMQHNVPRSHGTITNAVAISTTHGTALTKHAMQTLRQ